MSRAHSSAWLAIATSELNPSLQFSFEDCLNILYRSYHTRRDTVENIEVGAAQVSYKRAFLPVIKIARNAERVRHTRMSLV